MPEKTKTSDYFFAAAFRLIGTITSIARSNRSIASGASSMSAGFALFAFFTFDFLGVAMNSRYHEERDQFYAAIGRALTEWSSVENDLCNLFSNCIGRRSTYMTTRTFWAVISFEARLNMVDATMRGRFPDTFGIGSKWSAIYNSLVKRNRARNKIAHGTVLIMQFKNSASKTIIDVFFAPYFWGNTNNVSSATDPRPKDRMKLTDISKHTQDFIDLGGRIKELANSVRAEERVAAARA